MAVAVFTDDVFLHHDTGRHHPENAGRLRGCLEAIRRAGRAPESPASPARTADAIRAVHGESYLERLRAACAAAPAEAGGRAFALFDSPDNPLSVATYDAATRAAALTLAAVDRVASGGAVRAFVAARPPGHHARVANAMGFCFVNTIAVAARDLVARGIAGRVLVADFDVHHGNGTQEIFWRDPEVAYLSVHRFPFYPGTGGADETGSGPGLGATVNVPMQGGAGDPDYVEGFVSALEALADRFRPDFVLVSAGFDAHEDDPLGGMAVTTEGFARMTRALASVADVHAGGRLVSLLEGGYDPTALGRSATAHLDALEVPV